MTLYYCPTSRPNTHVLSTIVVDLKQKEITARGLYLFKFHSQIISLPLLKFPFRSHSNFLEEPISATSECTWRYKFIGFYIIAHFHIRQILFTILIRIPYRMEAHSFCSLAKPLLSSATRLTSLFEALLLILAYYCY